MRAAVIDVGSCTWHALAANVDEYGIQKVLFERKIAVRDRDSSPDALATLDHLITRTTARVAEPCRVIATGIYREPGNRDLVDEVCNRHGIAAEILDPGGEAELTWLGVSTELAGSHGSLAVVDLGATSLHLAIGADELDGSRSLPLGPLRLRDVPLTAIREHVAVAAAPTIAELRAWRPDTIAVTSGTSRALLALGRRLGLISDLQRHVGALAFADLARRLMPLPVETIAALGVSATRRDTIAAGAVVLSTVLDLLGRPVVYVARSALREGALVDLARRRRFQPLRLAAGQ